MTFFGKTRDGKLILNDKKVFDNFIVKLKDSVVELRVRKWRNKRSIPQNSLYWLWVGIMADDLGYDPDELHQSLKAMFLIDKSKRVPLVRSTTVLNKLEFTQYLDRVERLASVELGIILPQPENWRD